MIGTSVGESIRSIARRLGRAPRPHCGAPDRYPGPITHLERTSDEFSVMNQRQSGRSAPQTCPTKPSTKSFTCKDAANCAVS